MPAYIRLLPGKMGGVGDLGRGGERALPCFTLLTNVRQYGFRVNAKSGPWLFFV